MVRLQNRGIRKGIRTPMVAFGKMFNCLTTIGILPLCLGTQQGKNMKFLLLIKVKRAMKQREKQKYDRKFTIRFTEREFEQIQIKFKNTTCKKLSDYLRIMIMSKPLRVMYRNQTADEFLAGMIALKNELNAIGNNFNQSVKHLYSLQSIDDIKTWLLLNESTKQAFMSKVEEIKLRMQQLYELWSQK